MAKIMLRDGFKNLQVGEAQVLLVKRVKYNEKFQKIQVTFADGDGGTCVENFNLRGANGKPNDVAFGIFSTIYKCCTHDNSNREVDPTEIEGCRIVADVYQQIVKDEDGDETGRYIHVRNFRECEEDDEDGSDEGGWY